MKVIEHAKHCGTGEWLIRRKMVPSDSEDVSPNKVNLLRIHYMKQLLANLPDMMKPATDMEEITDCTCRVVSVWVIEERSHRKKYYGIWDILSASFSRRLREWKGDRGLIT